MVSVHWLMQQKSLQYWSGVAWQEANDAMIVAVNWLNRLSIHFDEFCQRLNPTLKFSPTCHFNDPILVKKWFPWFDVIIIPDAEGSTKFFLIKWANPGLFFVYFRSFQTNITILQQIYVKKCPFSIRCCNSNPRPSEHESLPITTRPGLPPR